MEILDEGEELGSMDRLEEDLQYQINDLSDAMEDVMKLLIQMQETKKGRI